MLDLTPFRVSRDFRILFLGQAVSDFGSEVTFVVIPYQVWTLTHSTLAVGLLGLCDLIPLLVTPAVGGMLADAFERRRLIILVYAVLAGLSLALVFNASLADPRLWVLYVVATANAGLYGIYSPAVRTWPARLVPVELLPSVFSLETTFFSLDALFGPAAAGVLIATIHPAGAYLVDAVSFGVGIAAIATMRPSPPAEEAPPPGLAAIRTTIEQTVVNDEMRGRLSGIALTVWAVGPSLGNVEAGLVASLVSVPFAIVSGGVACVLGAAVIGALVPTFRRYDSRHPQA
jgi:MFS family permease